MVPPEPQTPAGYLSEWPDREASGVVDEAVAFLRPQVDAGHRSALHCLACLLGRPGRVDEMAALLRPRLDDRWPAGVLVEATVGQGRDDDVIAEPATLVAAVQRHPDKWSAKPQNAPQLPAAVLERQGRRDEAIELLRHVR